MLRSILQLSKLGYDRVWICPPADTGLEVELPSRADRQCEKAAHNGRTLVLAVCSASRYGPKERASAGQKGLTRVKVVIDPSERSRAPNSRQ